MNKELLNELNSALDLPQNRPEDFKAACRVLDVAKRIFSEGFSRMDADDVISELLENRFEFDGRRFAEDYDLSDADLARCDDALTIWTMENAKCMVDEFFEG